MMSKRRSRTTVPIGLLRGVGLNGRFANGERMVCSCAALCGVALMATLVHGAQARVIGRTGTVAMIRSSIVRNAPLWTESQVVPLPTGTAGSDPDPATTPVAGAFQRGVASVARAVATTLGSVARPALIPTAGRTGNGCRITPVSARAEAQVFALLNSHRAMAGLPPLQLQPALSLVARAHACDMFRHHTLTHDGPDGSDAFARMARGGFSMPPYTQEGENVGYQPRLTPSTAVRRLDSDMMSESLVRGTHHWNIVQRGYTMIGLGVIAANGQTWLTEDFAG